MDKAIELETEPDYAPWRWYAGALQQHHYALLMATEIILNPRRKEAGRIWKGLDYVFEPPPLPPIARARWILNQAWWKMEVYTGKRQLRAPTDLELNLKESLRLSSEDSARDRSSSSPSTENTAPEEGSLSPPDPPGQQSKRVPQPTKKRSAGSKAYRGDTANLSRHDRPSPAGTAQATSGSMEQPATTSPAKQQLVVDWVRAAKARLFFRNLNILTS